MQCREFEERMQHLLDGRTAPESDPAVRLHARQCESCAQLLAAQAALFRGLRQLAMPSVSSEFSRHVVGQLATDVSRVRRAGTSSSRPWRLAIAVVSAAALALLAMTVGLRTWSRREPLVAPGTARQATTGQPSAPQLAVNPPREIVRPAAARSLDKDPLASPSPADASLEHFQEYGQAIGSIASQIPDAVERLDEVEQAAPAVRPVRTSFSLAIGTIRRTTLPGPQKPPAPKPGNRDGRL